MGKHKKVDFRRLNKSPARIPAKGFDVEALLHSELRSPTKQDLPALYILVSRQQVLYVGETISLKDRIAAHKTDKHFDTVFYWIAPQNSRKRLAQERRLIAKLRPPLNVRGLRGTDRRRLRRMPNTPRIQQEIECWALARNEVVREGSKIVEVVLSGRRHCKTFIRDRWQYPARLLYDAQAHGFDWQELLEPDEVRQHKRIVKERERKADAARKKNPQRTIAYKWTAKTPTKPGWYYRRTRLYPQPKRVEVYDGDGALYWRSRGKRLTEPFRLNSPFEKRRQVEWAPVTEPEE